MTQTKEGAKKAVASTKEKYGEDFYKRIGTKGGKKGGKKGFACMSAEKRAAAGRKGGKRSTRLGVKNGDGAHAR